MFSNAILTRAGVFLFAALAAPVVLAPLAAPAFADDKPADPKAVKEEDGKFFDVSGAPTYSIKPDGTVDWFTYSGFRRYHSECHVCHGPEGLGSSYAPALVDSLKTMDYYKFQEIVVGGRENVGGGNDKVMPSFGLNKNVMCYLDDIYVYLRARSDGALGRGRPQKRADKPPGVTDAEKACLGE